VYGGNKFILPFLMLSRLLSGKGDQGAAGVCPD
jgi:hypothetical protein